MAGCHCKEMLYCACWVPFKLIFLSSGVGKVILQLRNKGYKKNQEDGHSSLPFSVVWHIWYFDRAVMQDVWHQVQPCNLKDEKIPGLMAKSYRKPS